MLGRHKGLKVDLGSVMLVVGAGCCSPFLHGQDSMEMVISPSSHLKSKGKKSVCLCAQFVSYFQL